MNRIGWIFIGLFAALIAAAVVLVDFGGSGGARPRRAVPVTVAGSAEPVGMLTLPVQGVAWRDVAHSWGDLRGGGMRRHTGTDIMAPRGTPVIAAAPGSVEKLFFSRGGGGITLYVRSPDRRLSYYYAHLDGYAPGMREGMQVSARQLLGYVGDTGNAGRGNTHLHFGIERLMPGEPWHRGRAVDPYPLLARGRPQG